MASCSSGLMCLFQGCIYFSSLYFLQYLQQKEQHLHLGLSREEIEYSASIFLFDR